MTNGGLAGKPRIGAHLSIAKGLPEAARRAAEVGGDTFQFFTRNPRGGAVRALGVQEVERWQAARRAADIYPIVGHLPYTVNLAANKPSLLEFNAMVLAEDLARADLMGAEFLVTHPGSHLGDGMEEGLRRIVAALERVLRDRPARSALLLETMAGQGTEVGGELKHLAEIIRALGSPPGVGVCLDSCHLFAAGHDLRQPEGVARLVDDLDRTCGLDRVRAIHLNDSREPLGSRRDRHALLGQGALGRAGIQAIVTNPFIRGLPMLIETPVDDYRDYAAEIRLARELAAG